MHFYLLNPLSFLLFLFGVRYIYGGILDVDLQDPELILDVLIAADELYFVEVLDYLQDLFLKQTQN